MDFRLLMTLQVAVSGAEKTAQCLTALASPPQ